MPRYSFSLVSVPCSLPPFTSMLSLTVIYNTIGWNKSQRFFKFFWRNFREKRERSNLRSLFFLIFSQCLAGCPYNMMFPYPFSLFFNPKGISSRHIPCPLSLNLIDLPGYNGFGSLGPDGNDANLGVT